MYMQIPFFPRLPRLVKLGSKLVKRLNPEIDILGIPMGDCCALGMASTINIMSGLLE